MNYLFSRKYCTSLNKSLGIILSATLNKSAGGCLQPLLLLVLVPSILIVLLCLLQNLENENKYIYILYMPSLT